MLYKAAPSCFCFTCTHLEDKFVSTEYDTVSRSECISQTGGLPGELRTCEGSRIHTDSVHNHPAHPAGQNLSALLSFHSPSDRLSNARVTWRKKPLSSSALRRTLSLNSVLSSLTHSRNHHDHQPTQTNPSNAAARRAPRVQTSGGTLRGEAE